MMMRALLYFPLNLTPVCPMLTAFSLTSLATIGTVTLASAIDHCTAAGQTPVDCPQWCLAICVKKWGALILSGENWRSYNHPRVLASEERGAGYRIEPQTKVDDD